MTSSAVVGDIVAKLDNPTVKWVAVGAGVSGAAYLAMKVSWFRKNPFHSFGGKTGAMAKDLVNSGINSYNQFFEQEDGKGVGSRILSTPEFVDKFYSLITDFYEYGWGESFHFAAREIGESFEASIIRQETGTSPPEPRARRFSPRARLAPAGGANVRRVVFAISRKRRAASLSATRVSLLPFSPTRPPDFFLSLTTRCRSGTQPSRRPSA